MEFINNGIYKYRIYLKALNKKYGIYPSYYLRQLEN